MVAKREFLPTVNPEEPETGPLQWESLAERRDWALGRTVPGVHPEIGPATAAGRPISCGCGGLWSERGLKQAGCPKRPTTLVPKPGASANNRAERPTRSKGDVRAYHFIHDRTGGRRLKPSRDAGSHQER